MFSGGTLYSPLVLWAIVIIPGVAALWFLGTGRRVLAAFTGGLSMFGLHMSLVVLAEADWANIYQSRLYDKESTLLESSNGIGLLPQAVFDVPIIIGLALFATSAILAWRQKLEYRRYSQMNNDDTQEVSVGDGMP